MKAKAKHWINVNGDWYKPGEVFETESVAGIETAVEVIAEEPKVVEPVQQEEVKQKPTGTRRARKVSAE